MKRRVYIETTVVSYLTALPSRDLIRAAHQRITCEWWDSRRDDFELYISQIVADESGAGDPDAAQRRLGLLQGIPRLEITEQVAHVTRSLLEHRAIPEKAVEDALHIAIAAVHGMDFLLTWNCAHIANAEMLDAITSAIGACGFPTPIICTPEELLGETP